MAPSSVPAVSSPALDPRAEAQSPHCAPTLPGPAGQSPIHLSDASALGDPELKSGHAWVCVCSGSAGVREALGGGWRGGPSSRGPRRCGSRYL